MYMYVTLDRIELEKSVNLFIIFTHYLSEGIIIFLFADLADTSGFINYHNYMYIIIENIVTLLTFICFVLIQN